MQPRGTHPLNSNSHHKNIGILGLGTAVPDRVLSNKDLEAMVDTSDEWILTRTGIRERRILDPDQPPSDIAIPAAQAAMADAGVSPDEIGAIIYCSYIPDYLMPPSSCVVQGRLGVPSCMTFDLNAACTGFVTGLQTAHALVLAGTARKVLVIGCDCASKVLDYTDRDTCVLFGDGAGAAVVGEVSNGRGILGSISGADGKGAMLICQRIGAGAHPLRPENMHDPNRYMKMNGREVFKFAVRILQDALEQAVEKSGLKIGDIDLLVPHQANVRIINAAMERFGFDPQRVVINMDRYGNTSAASIPLALEDARRDGRLKRGSKIAMVAFGAGLTYGATVMEW